MPELQIMVDRQTQHQPTAEPAESAPPISADTPSPTPTPIPTAAPRKPPALAKQSRKVERPGWLTLPHMRFPNAYLWTVLLSTLDIILTTKILFWFGGDEANPMALLIIDHWGMAGASAFKFALVLFAIIICEIVDRSRLSAGRFLAVTMVVLSAVPVVWSFYLMMTNMDLLDMPIR